MPQRRAESLVLAIDIGSSSTRTGVFDQLGRLMPRSQASESYSIRYTGDGGAELSPFILRRAAKRCLEQSWSAYEQVTKRRRPPVIAIAGSAFWHGLLGLDARGRPITPVFTWADFRSAKAAIRLRETVAERDVHQRTGCRLHSSFWPAKLVWLRQDQPSLFRRVARWVSPADWIFSELFHTTGTSPSMASGTGFYDRYRNQWDKKLCSVCGVNPSHLPELLPSQIALRRSSKVETPPRIFLAIGDGAAGNLGSGADAPGVVAINIGTSAAVRMIRKKGSKKIAKVPFGLFEYVVDSDRLLIGGAVSNAGNLREWALRELRLDETTAMNREVYSRAAAANDRLTALPFWASERAPTWPNDHFGVIDGITQSTKAPEIMRTLTSSVFYRLTDILDLLPHGQRRRLRLIVSGGILRSLGAVRLLADSLGHDLEMASAREASLRGAAVYALQQLNLKAPCLRRGRRITHNPRLAQLHQLRRERQQQLEQILSVGRA